MYVYIQSEPGLWTVGFYDPAGQWHSDSDHSTRNDAAERVHWLNGGMGATPEFPGVDIDAIHYHKRGLPE